MSRIDESNGVHSRPHRRSDGLGHTVAGRRSLGPDAWSTGSKRAGIRWPTARSSQDERSQKSPSQLRLWVADPEIDVVISTGGTGLTGRDVTVEAHRDVYEKEIEAFGTVFTIVSMEKIGTSAVQSRATGWCGGRNLSVCVAGQPGCLQRRVGRDSGETVRLSPPPLQFCGNNAPIGRTPATEVDWSCV